MTNEEALNDLRRRYEGTFVWLAMEEKGEESLVYVNRVENNESKIGVLHLTSEKFGTLSINLGSSDHNLQFRYPPVGVFQYGCDAVAFHRRPARQYRRGLCSDNSSMLDVTRHVTSRSVAWTHLSVQSAFDHNVSTFAVALEALKNKPIRSMALANNFSISKSMVSTFADHILWHWMNPVALIDPKTGKLTKLLEQAYGHIVQGVVNQ